MRLVFAFFILLSALSNAHGQILFAEISDSHSNYDNMLGFLNDLSVQVEKFKLEYPRGQIVLLVNGDYSGASGLASASVDGRADEGAIGINALVDLSKAGVKVVYNSGNHDGHDFAKRHNDNHVFKREMTTLASAGNEIVLLGTNIDFTNDSGLAPLFTQSYDIKDPASGVTRVYGLTLEDMYSKSSVVLEKDQLFLKISSYEATLRKELLKAANDGLVDQVIIMIHDSTPAVELVAKRIEAKFKGRISFAGWFAGHDHVQKNGFTAAGNPLINAGSQFEHMVAFLGNKGPLTNIQVSSSTEIGKARIDSLKTPIAMRIARVAKKVESEIKNVKSAMERNVHGFTENLVHGKIELKKMPRLPLGNALGNTFRNWAQSSFGDSLNGRPVIGFFNTSSYRIDNGYSGKVAINDLLLAEIYPFDGSPKILELTGQQFLEMARKIVWYKESLTSVQFSDNVRVLFRDERKPKENDRHISISVPEIIEIKTANGGWRTLGADEHIIVGVDSWTGENGYKIDFSKNIHGHSVAELRFMNQVFGDGHQPNLKIENESGSLSIFQEYLAKEFIAMPRDLDPNLLPKSVSSFYCQRFYQPKTTR